MPKATNLAVIQTIDDNPVTEPLTAEFITVTPSIAQDWLGHNTGNRNLKTTAVSKYVRDMEDGAFLLTGESVKFDWNGRMIDGQNRCTAVIESGKSVPMLVVRGLDPATQKVLDSGAKRSAGDALKMSGHHANPHVMAATIKLLNAWISGALATSASRASEVTHSEVLSIYRDYGDDLDAAVSLAQRWYKDIEGATPSPLALCVFLTSKVDAEASFRFFHDIAKMNLGGDGDQRVVLAKRLKSLRGERAIPAQQIYFILRAWNAWRENSPLRGMKDSAMGTATRIPEPK